MKTVDFCGIFKLMLLVLHSFNALQWFTSCAMICTTEAAEADTFNERDGIGNEDNVKQSNTFVKKIPLSKLCWLISYRGSPHRQVQQHNQSPFNWQFGFVANFFLLLICSDCIQPLGQQMGQTKVSGIDCLWKLRQDNALKYGLMQIPVKFFQWKRKQSTKTATINENVTAEQKCQRSTEMSTNKENVNPPDSGNHLGNFQASSPRPAWVQTKSSGDHHTLLSQENLYYFQLSCECFPEICTWNKSDGGVGSPE